MKELFFNSVEEILAFAIKVEDEASIYYSNQAKKATDIRLRTLWAQLANDEPLQKSVLMMLQNKIEKKTDGMKTYSTRDITDYSPAAIPLGNYPSETEKIIISAIEKENESVYLYRYLAHEVDNILYQRVLLTISEEKLGHIESLTKALDIIKGLGGNS